MLPGILFAACTSDTVTTPQPTPTASTATIQVTNGYGSGTATVGDSVFVWSNPPAPGTVFVKWMGDVSGLKYPNEWKSKVSVPATGLIPAATYKASANITFVSETINGSSVYYYVPMGYKGVILPFHGAGGNASGWIGTNVENDNFVRYAVANGYAAVITESQDRVNKRWSNAPTNNPDINAINAVLATLKQRAILLDQTNLFGVGMSQGSGFCSLITALNSYKAGALYCVPGISAVFDQSTVPILWNISRNDVAEEPTRLADSYANYKKLAGRGIRAEFYVNEPSPVYPKRFTIVPGVDKATSILLHNDLKKGEQLDSNDFFRTNPRQSDAWKSALSGSIAGNRALVNGIEDQLFVCYAEHKFYRDANARTISFFDKSL
ncbi:alpha/beta hydrolase family protein [Spirosoma arcticum]